MTTAARTASPDVVSATYAAIQSDADLDGLCTTTLDRLAELSGVSRSSAQAAVRQMVDSGDIALVVRRSHHLEISLPEDGAA